MEPEQKTLEEHLKDLITEMRQPTKEKYAACVVIGLSGNNIIGYTPDIYTTINTEYVSSFLVWLGEQQKTDGLEVDNAAMKRQVN